jgi:hypothetical protein
MSKLYTFTISKNVLFLESDPPEGINLSNYRLVPFRVNGENINCYMAEDKLSYLIENTNSLPKIQTNPLLKRFQSIESQGNNLILITTLEKMNPADMPSEHHLSQEEIQVRLQISREIGFEIVEQDI